MRADMTQINSTTLFVALELNRCSHTRGVNEWVGIRPLPPRYRRLFATSVPASGTTEPL